MRSIVSCGAVSGGDKGTEIVVDGIVGRQACLQRVHTPWRVAFVLESFHVSESYVSTECPSWCNAPVSPHAVEELAREVLVESQEVRAYADHRVGVGIAEAKGEVQAGGGSDIRHHIDACLWVDVDESDLACFRVSRVVEQSYLYAPRMALRHVEDADLRSPQRIGIVIGAELQSSHLSGADVCDGRELHSLSDAHGDVGDGADLNAFHRREDDVVETGDLYPIEGVSHIGKGCEHETVGPPAHSTEKHAVLETVQRVDLAEQSYIQRGAECRVGMMVVNADSHVRQPVTFGCLSL